MLKKLLQLVTGEDNVTLEPAYWWAAAAFVVGLGLEIYCTVAGKPFDLTKYGLGCGALLTGLGLGKHFGS